MAISATLLFVLLFLIKGIVCEDTRVKTELGTISGERTKVDFLNKDFTVDKFVGIPYAKPPVGALRFKKPEHYGPFTEPFSATKVGAICPQHELPFMKLEGTVQSEDCLFLNIYVPVQRPDKESGHAVMLFVHGGGFSLGAGSIYQGEVLASVGNVIIVTINYRLGLLGFLDTGDEKAAGNFGLWDQHFALQWVNKHISAFGGDKDRVTIFGESAGSMSVALQMLYPQNEGLFVNGITESGAHTLPGLYQENNLEAAKLYAENMSCSIESTDEVFKCLQSASTESIIKVVSDLFADGMAAGMKIGTLPTIDADLIKENPADLYRRSENENCPEIDFYRSVKLMNGLNGQEGAMFLFYLGDIEHMDELEVTREQMNSIHIPTGAAIMYGAKQLPEVLTQVLISDYTNWENPDCPKTLREEVVRLFSDVYFNVPGIEMSRVHSNSSKADSYLYNFVALLDKHLLPTPNWIKRANHGDELGPVFGYNFDFKLLANLSDYTPPEWELTMSKRMMIYWTNFAKTGNPNEPQSEAISSVTWPKYETVSQSYMIFDREDTTGQYLFARERDLWRNILPALLDATEHAQTITSKYGGTDKETCDKDGNC